VTTNFEELSIDTSAFTGTMKIFAIAIDGQIRDIATQV